MKFAVLAVATVLSACAGPAPAISAPTQTPIPPSPVAAANPSALATTTPGPSPTLDVTEPIRAAHPGLPYLTPDIRSVGGQDFVFIGDPADLFIDRGIGDRDVGEIWQQVADDVRAVEREFARRYFNRPRIYVFGSAFAYATGFNRIFGYPKATADFVADNSVSFFEPANGLIAVNWEAVRDRRPVAAMRHELTHLLTLDACAPRCDLVPAWFNEGQARLAEAMIPGADWRMVRVRYEAASMASTGTLLPLSQLTPQSSWNAIVSWGGYYKYQQAARTTELLRQDVGGETPIARVYARISRGEKIGQAYANLTGKSWDSFVLALPERIRTTAP